MKKATTNIRIIAQFIANTMMVPHCDNCTFRRADNWCKKAQVPCDLARRSSGECGKRGRLFEGKEP